MSLVRETPSTRVSAFCDDALGQDDAVELSRRIAAGEVSRVEVVTAAIERARVVNPTLNAIAHAHFEGALAEAHHTGGGRFGGLPTFVKDTDPVAGMPFRMGSLALSDAPVSKSSAYVKQLLGTGLVCLGKTTLPEFGLTCTTESVAYGPTRNPWNTGYSTGGSSGGSSALVAAGVVPLAHANDGGGSIRIPASCCGLVGLKPSRGRLVEADGAAFFPINIISQGVVTRTVRDTAAFLAAAEKVVPSRRYAPVGLVEGPGKKPLRIGCFTDSPLGEPSHPDCVAAVAKAAKLCESLGHHVEMIPCPFDDGHLVPDFFAYWGFPPFGLRFLGRLIFGRGFDYTKLDPWSQYLANEFRRNLRRMPGVLRRLRAFARDYDALFSRYDVLICPTLAEPPVPLGYISPDVDEATAVERVTRYATFTPVQNLSGAAAISVPLARSADGLPIGVHLAGDCGSERRLLELAFGLEEAVEGWGTLAGAIL